MKESSTCVSLFKMVANLGKHAVMAKCHVFFQKMGKVPLAFGGLR